MAKPDIVGICGERVRLVPLDAERHLENYVRWLNDPEVTRYLGTFMPLSRLSEQAFFESAARAEDRVIWAVHDEHDRHIGGTDAWGVLWEILEEDFFAERGGGE